LPGRWQRSGGLCLTKLADVPALADAHRPDARRRLTARSEESARSVRKVAGQVDEKPGRSAGRAPRPGRHGHRADQALRGVPGRLRRRCGLRAGDHVLLAASPGQDMLATYSVAVLTRHCWHFVPKPSRDAN
jgi:hypothetical protein